MLDAYVLLANAFDLSENFTPVTVHWVSGISYVNASCTTMTQMTLDYLVPFGIIVG